jgi:TetR/AcrR family transcriptional regulator, transcriptional repressor for nem operon
MPAVKDAKRKLLDAALGDIRRKGYAATTVDDLCRAAGVTKGAFFHHFRSKEELGVAAAAHFGEMAAGVFAEAPYRLPADPRERVLAYVDFRREILQGELPEYTCLLGTMVQELYATHPAIRDACAREIAGHAATLEDDIAAAVAASGRAVDGSPASLALHIQAVLQGAFVLAKATDGPNVAADSLRHLRRYLQMLFYPETQGEVRS